MASNKNYLKLKQSNTKQQNETNQNKAKMSQKYTKLYERKQS